MKKHEQKKTMEENGLQRGTEINNCTVKVLRSWWLKASTEVLTTIGVSMLT